MSTIWVLTKYEYDTYSYSGLSPNESFYFLTKDGAEKFAIEKGFKITYNVTSDKHASLEEEPLRP